MKLSEHKDLKKEILALPPKEKDKLLLRLIAKDKVLTEHLHFLLLEDESHLQDRVAAIKQTILENTVELQKSKRSNAKEVLSSLRKMAKLVNHNFRVTKADTEDVELRLFLQNETITEFKFRLFSSYKNYEHQFAVYYIKYALVSLRKFYKLHEDLQFDLKEDFNRLLEKINRGYLADTARELGLPKEV